MRGHRLVSDQDLPIRMRCIPDQLRIWSILSGNALASDAANDRRGLPRSRTESEPACQAAPPSLAPSPKHSTTPPSCRPRSDNGSSSPHQASSRLAATSTCSVRKQCKPWHTRTRQVRQCDQLSSFDPPVGWWLEAQPTPDHLPPHRIYASSQTERACSPHERSD